MDASSSLVIKWSGKEFTIPVDGTDTVSDFKRKVAELINVQPKRQKVLGLKAAGGKLAGDEALIGDLALKPGQKLLVMG
jgi:ubiquitin-like domain-containing CTD phosphatase 1